MTLYPSVTSTEAILLARKERLYQDIQRAEQQLDLLHAFGVDDFEEGAVIRFDKHPRHGAKTYAYVAIKAPGGWYTSGPVAGGRCFAWDELVKWLIDGPFPTYEVWIVSGYERIVPAP